MPEERREDEFARKDSQLGAKDLSSDIAIRGMSKASTLDEEMRYEIPHS